MAPGGRESLSFELIILIVQYSSIKDNNRMEGMSHGHHHLLSDLSLARWGHCNLHGEISALIFARGSLSGYAFRERNTVGNGAR